MYTVIFLLTFGEGCAILNYIRYEHIEANTARCYIEATPALDWLLLTKRPENMLRFTPWVDQWPTNIWAMTSVENQEQAQRRIPELLRVPAPIKALSMG